MNQRNSFLEVGNKKFTYYPINQIDGSQKLPYSLKILLENVLRNAKDDQIAELLSKRIIEAGLNGEIGDEIEFSPARVLFQDFTGVPVFVDFAVMREACLELGGNPANINPQIPCDLVIDHSVIANYFGTSNALAKNMEVEFKQNKERYEFLKWAQESFKNVRIVPPGSGICHQLNIECFADVVRTNKEDDKTIAFFDTLVGTDSHTPTANGIGVLGWGVGGIEAEAAALGQPITTLVPKVVGVELIGKLNDDVSAMDLALTFAHLLRKEGVVGCFVEVFGSGVQTLSTTQRACVSNMTPEYGSTCTLFPIDEQTIKYLQLTGRNQEQIQLIESYAKAQGLWNDSSKDRIYSKVLKIDLSNVTKSLAGPSRPHDLIKFDQAQKAFQNICKSRDLSLDHKVPIEIGNKDYRLTHGAIAIAAVTSCTTATDASMMLTAGLLARNASLKGLKPKPWVKTILAPGSKATLEILENAKLIQSLNELGFYVCGFGCMSCIGNSGPVLPSMHEIANDIELCAVLSGNRNFDGRISPDVSQNYLCSPALVIAYSLVGTMDYDVANQPLGQDDEGNYIYLHDIWPTAEEVSELLTKTCTKDIYKKAIENLYRGNNEWKDLPISSSDVFDWNPNSTYVRRAPYFNGMTKNPQPLPQIKDAHALLMLDDFITTDHISPAGAISPDSPAARYLEQHGVQPSDFNTYGSRRGNHEVMMRGTFSNGKLQNKLVENRRGGWTLDQLDGQIKYVWDAAENYMNNDIDLIVIAGKMYGSGSSRDWAAKGPMLQGIKAVFAESYERIHRSNLIGMGILPLQFEEGQNKESLSLDGTETYTIEPIDFSHGLPSPAHVAVTVYKDSLVTNSFSMIVRIDTPTEGYYYRNGGILQYVLRSLVK